MVTKTSFQGFRMLNNLSLDLAPVTMLTGSNGVGKTTVLEGLYCLLSETRLDVSPLSRYNRAIGLPGGQTGNASGGFIARQRYNYKLFWEECPTHEQSECSVTALTDNGLTWSWGYKKATLADLSKTIIANNPIPVDTTTEFALWEWSAKGKVIDNKSLQPLKINELYSRVQILSPDGGLYLLPIEGKALSYCRFIDFTSGRVQPQKMSFNTARQLTAALRLINHRITDVRLKDIESGLSVVIDDKYEVSLGTIGNGAVTWASVLIAIFDVIESAKLGPQFDVPVMILIDEMGAGIHYSIMTDVWMFLKEFMKHNSNIQFVFTSHSDDCIESFCKAFINDDNAKIIRLHQSGDTKDIVPTDYTNDSFDDIISGAWEVRG